MLNLSLFILDTVQSCEIKASKRLLRAKEDAKASAFESLTYF